MKTEELIERIKNCGNSERSEKLERYIKIKEDDEQKQKYAKYLIDSFSAKWHSKICDWIFQVNLLIVSGYKEDVSNFNDNIKKIKNYKLEIPTYTDGVFEIYVDTKRYDLIWRYFFPEKRFSCISFLDFLVPDDIIKLYENLEKYKIFETFEKDWNDFLINLTK